MERRCWFFAVLILLVSLGFPAPAWSEGSQQPAEDDYELYQIFADTIDQVERNYVKGIDRRELMEAAIQGVLDKLDPYSNYISPDEIGRFKSSVESQFGGIGIQIGIENAQLKVISPLVGTPAYRAGLLAGDAILEIDGKTTKGIQIDQAVKRLKGEAGTKVNLVIRHPGSLKSEPVTIKRASVHIDTVLGDHRNDRDAWEFILDPEKKIGYVRITAFSRDTARDLRKALVELQSQGMRGLIIDLRFNPGGLLTSAIEVSDMFISDGKIVSTKGRNTVERTWDAEQDGTFSDFPMAVLVNHYSASASEIFSACMQDHDRAVVIGERTWGKGSVQNIIELEGGKSALKLTTASYHRPSGKNIHRFPDAKPSDEWGVLPDPGFELTLDRSQTEQLILNRRKRDIVDCHYGVLLADKDKPAEDTDSADDAESGKNEDVESPPDAEKAKNEQPKPQAPQPDEAKPDEAKPEEAKPDEPESDAAGPPKDGKPKSEESPHAPADEQAAKSDDGSEKPAKSQFVDLQLQKAVVYLSQQLDKAE
jgi:carboxyl-terminal processing protease